MNVQPSLITHPKFTLFRNAIGNRAAECLLRLWGHCQTMQRGENWGKVGADYVEAVCEWSGEQGKLFEALARKFCGKPGWVQVKKNGALIVTGWEEHNASLINSWRAGGMGGRPKKPGDNPRVNRKKPGDNPRVTGGEPTENPIGVDRIGEEGSGDPDARAREARDFPEAEIPSLAEVLTFCRGPAGIPEETGRKFHAHYEKTASPAWTDGAGKRFQWRGKLAAWHARDREKNGGATGQNAVNREQLQAELASPGTDAARRREIRMVLEVAG